MVSRECIETLDGIQVDDNTRPILTVSQLWLWRSGEDILTAYSEEESESFEDIVKETRTLNSPEHSIFQAGHIIAHHLQKFNKPQAGGKFPSPLDIFEVSVVRILSDVEAYTDPNKQLLPEDIEKERGFIHRIADVREELVMIREILDQQKEILRDFIQDVERQELDAILDGAPTNSDFRSWVGLKSSAEDIDLFQKRVAKIDRDAERIENLIQNQLNVKRTYASIRDARTGLILSAAVIGFTVITIIFAPLAFMTSLFALPLEGLLKNQYQLDRGNGRDPITAYTTKYVAAWFGKY